MLLVLSHPVGNFCLKKQGQKLVEGDLFLDVEDHIGDYLLQTASTYLRQTVPTPI